MLSLYEKYRIESTSSWDYRNAGRYFVTICTHNRKPHFGHCESGTMTLSPIGEIAHRFWMEIPNHFNNAAIDAFVVMPNHVHGIIVLNDLMEPAAAVETSQCDVSTTNKKQFMSNISPKSGSLSTLIRSYKSACTKQITMLMPDADFSWQARFHDHIIKNERSFKKIQHYIQCNPQNWNSDQLFHK